VGQKKDSTVVAIGVFDGVHSGHKFLVAQAKKIAEKSGKSLTIASFSPHPVSVLRPDNFLGLLTSPTFRTQLLKEAGADHVEYIEFTTEVSQMLPDEFVDLILIQKLNASTVVVGENFRFGAKASGDLATLKTLSTKYGFTVEAISLVGDGDAWSSTRIRNNIIAGDVKLARELLGRPHRLTGEVIHGDKRGRELGYPTANIAIRDQLIVPADGVYSALVQIQNESLPAAVSIGKNPTFSEVSEKRVEAYILDRNDLALYGQIVDLDFVDFVRPMVQFAGISELLEAMASDVQIASRQISDFLDSASH